jgi:predicted Zn-dependent protease with MMP-like domain
METTREEFEELVLQYIEEIPDKFKDRLENIDFVIEEEFRESDSNMLTLALYQGVPYNRRGRGIRILPDKITIYKKAIEKVSRNREELKRRLKSAIRHEIGHYFGISEKKLRDLGY